MDALKRSRTDRYDPQGQASGGAATDAYPKTERGWQRRYNWLWDCYAGKPYTDADVKSLKLFSAYDDNGDVIDRTRRLSRDFQHIIDTDVRALAVRLSLESSAGSDGSRVSEGEAVWRRSGLHNHLSAWSRDFAVMGDWHVEPVKQVSGGAKHVAYDARHVTPLYSDDCTELERATIRVPFFDDDGTPQVYNRVLTRTSVEWWYDDDRAPDGMSGGAGYKHDLGVVPLCHVRFTPFGPPEHGLSAGHAVAEALGFYNSILTQAKAIANRYGNPQMVVIGAMIEAGSDAAKFGRALNLPAGTDAKYLEAALGQVQALWQLAREYGEDVRGTIPEFMFSGSGANTSGRALDLRADQFRLKMEEVRGRWYGAIAKATQLAVLLDDGGTYDPDDEWYRIKAPPVLPIDKSAMMGLVTQAHTLGAISKADMVRHMQAIGLVDEQHDADDYAASLPTQPTEPAQ